MKLPITEKEYKEAIWNYNASVILSFLTGLAIALAAQQSVQADGDYCTCKPYPAEVIRDGCVAIATVPAANANR